jgi:alpha-L-fucosidase
MKRYLTHTLTLVLGLALTGCLPEKEKTDRMDWWREARFGMFIHWGLYAIPAGEWNGEKGYGEWIRTSAQIPLEQYEQFLGQFNPVRFNPEEWVRIAKDAGMKYIVITSKHHDGFCLWDSRLTDWDIMSTPYGKDILKQLQLACEKEGIRLCFYHSIMDWHHPDYLPRREWENDRTAEGADFSRYVAYLKGQLQELSTGYGDIGVFWFDGEWEGTWTHEMGQDLYQYVRSLRPDIIINNRVDKGREGMEGLTREGGYAGDFGTPEQEIPALGLPGVDWESCMTMNDHWGYNKHDHNWKSAGDLIRKLVDIASKGGNFLLNVGPTAEGIFPEESVKRLNEIGNWLEVYGESIYGTEASPFQELTFGRCTQKVEGHKTILYLHVFDPPKDNKLVLPGLRSRVMKVWTVKGKNKLSFEKTEGDWIIKTDRIGHDPYVTVIAVEIAGKPDVVEPPEIIAMRNIFLDSVQVEIRTKSPGTQIRFTTDLSDPVATSEEYHSPVSIKKNTLVKARLYEGEKALSPVSELGLIRVVPHPGADPEHVYDGFRYKYYEGDWDKLPDYSLLAPLRQGVIDSISLTPKLRDEYYGFLFEGYIRVPEDGIYAFILESDDGSRLVIDDHFVLDNNGLHGMLSKKGEFPLQAGYHKIKVAFFEKTGSDDLKLIWKKAE